MVVRDISGNSSDRLLSRRGPGIPCEREYALQSDRYSRVKILCISDRVEPMLYGPNLTSYARGVEAVISCGDSMLWADDASISSDVPGLVRLRTYGPGTRGRRA